MGDQSEKIVASMTDLEDQLGNVGSRLVQGWSIGRSLATSLMRNSEHNRKLGTIFIAVGDSIQDAIREQRNLATIMLRTGRESSLLNAELIGTMNMHGLSFKEAADVLQNTFVGGLNKSDKTTLKLMGQLQLLGVDVRKSVTMTAMNRHVLGMSVSESENLVKSMVETASQYRISTNAVIDAVNGLRETLKSTTITYGPAVSKAIEQAMPRLLGIFGQEAGGEISTVVAALLGGGPKQAELAAKLGIPLEDLSGARTSGKVVDLVMKAVSQLEGIVSPMRGVAGSEFSINAMIKAFGDVPELVLLGRRLNDMTGLQKQENQERQFADMASKAQRDVLVSLFNDVKRGLTSVLLPILGGVAVILGILNQVVGLFTSLFNSSLNLGDILGRILGAMTASWALKNLGPMLTSMLAVMRGQSVRTAASATHVTAALMAGGSGAVAKKGLTAGLGAKLVGRGVMGMSPIGIGLLLVSLVPWTKIFGKQDDMIEEQKKQTDLMQGEQERLQSRMVDQVSQAVHLLSVLNDTQLAAVEEQNPLLGQIAAATITTADKTDSRADRLETSISTRPPGTLEGQAYQRGANPVNP